jgi:hypothetical protein
MEINDSTVSKGERPERKESDESAQKKELNFKRRAFFQVNGALAVPIGDYGSMSLYNYNAQFAKAGYDISIEGGITIYKWIGFCATAGIASNGAKLEDYYSLGNYYVLGLYTSNFKANSYKHIYATAGVLVSIPVKSYFDLDIKMQVGLSSGSEGEISFVGTDTLGTNYQIEIEKVSDLGAMPNLGLTIRKNISDMWCVAVNVNYKGSHYEYVNREVSFNGTNGLVAPYDREIHLISVGLGLGVSF